MERPTWARTAPAAAYVGTTVQAEGVSGDKITMYGRSVPVEITATHATHTCDRLEVSIGGTTTTTAMTSHWIV